MRAYIIFILFISSCTTDIENKNVENRDAEDKKLQIEKLILEKDYGHYKIYKFHLTNNTSQIVNIDTSRKHRSILQFEGFYLDKHYGWSVSVCGSSPTYNYKLKQGESLELENCIFEHRGMNGNISEYDSMVLSLPYKFENAERDTIEYIYFKLASSKDYIEVKRKSRKQYRRHI